MILIGAAGVTAAYAQDRNPPILPGGPVDGHGPRGGQGLGPVEFQAAADELTSALGSGGTLEEAADETGVDYQRVRDGISAAHEVEIHEQVEQGLSDGTQR